MDKWSVIQYLEERAEDFYKLSDKIWENAEIRFKEKQSVKDYVSFLKNEGFSITVGQAGLNTGFRAEKKRQGIIRIIARFHRKLHRKSWSLKQHKHQAFFKLARKKQW